MRRLSPRRDLSRTSYIGWRYSSQAPLWQGDGPASSEPMNEACLFPQRPHAPGQAYLWVTLIRIGRAILGIMVSASVFAVALLMIDCLFVFLFKHPSLMMSLFVKGYDSGSDKENALYHFLVLACLRTTFITLFMVLRAILIWLVVCALDGLFAHRCCCELLGAKHNCWCVSESAAMHHFTTGCCHLSESLIATAEWRSG